MRGAWLAAAAHPAAQRAARQSHQRRDPERDQDADAAAKPLEDVAEGAGTRPDQSAHVGSLWQVNGDAKCGRLHLLGDLGRKLELREARMGG